MFRRCCRKSATQEKTERSCRTTSSKSWRAKAAVLPAADSRMEQKMKFVLNESTGSTRMIKNANSANHIKIPTFKKFTRISSENRRRIKPINFFIRITYRGRLIKSNLNAIEGRKFPPLFYSETESDILVAFHCAYKVIFSVTLLMEKFH